MFNLISPVRAVKMEGSLFTKENIVFKILLTFCEHFYVLAI